MSDWTLDDVSQKFKLAAQKPSSREKQDLAVEALALEFSSLDDLPKEYSVCWLTKFFDFWVMKQINKGFEKLKPYEIQLHS